MLKGLFLTLRRKNPGISSGLKWNMTNISWKKINTAWSTSRMPRSQEVLLYRYFIQPDDEAQDYQVLLISSNYDAFMLEEDGRIDETISWNMLHWTFVTRPIHQGTRKRKLLKCSRIKRWTGHFHAQHWKNNTFDLAVRSNRNTEDPDRRPTPFSREVNLKLKEKDFSAIDYVFSCSGMPISAGHH